MATVAPLKKRSKSLRAARKARRKALLAADEERLDTHVAETYAKLSGILAEGSK